MDVHLAVAVLRVAVGRDARRKAERLRPLGEAADHGEAGAGDDWWVDSGTRWYYHRRRNDRGSEGMLLTRERNRDRLECVSV